ncbi:MAG: hypothetical protein WBA93_00130 [Microcoleaceae cyanobacterium]
MTKLLYCVSMGILAFWILRGESVAVGSEETQLMTLSQHLFAQAEASESEGSNAQPTIPEPEVPEKSNTVTNLIQSTDPQEREKVLRQELGNQSSDTTVAPSDTISVPRGRDPFSAIPEIPVPDLTPEESSVAQLPEIQGQQLPSLPTVQTTVPTTWQQNARRIVPSDDSLIAQQRRRRPSPSSAFEPDMNSAFDSTFVERGC